MFSLFYRFFVSASLFWLVGWGENSEAYAVPRHTAPRNHHRNLFTYKLFFSSSNQKSEWQGGPVWNGTLLPSGSWLPNSTLTAGKVARVVNVTDSPPKGRVLDRFNLTASGPHRRVHVAPLLVTTHLKEHVFQGRNNQRGVIRKKWLRQ